MPRTKEFVIRDINYSMESLNTNIGFVSKNFKNIPQADLLELEKSIGNINKFIIDST